MQENSDELVEIAAKSILIAADIRGGVDALPAVMDEVWAYLSPFTNTEKPSRAVGKVERSDTVTDRSASGETPDKNRSIDRSKVTGELFVKAFRKDLAERRAREETPAEGWRAVPEKYTSTLSFEATFQLDDGRDPKVIRRAVSRMALRYDEYPWINLPDAINDVLHGKPYTPEMVQGMEQRFSGDVDDVEVTPGPAPQDKEEQRRRRKEDYEWLFK